MTIQNNGGEVYRMPFTSQLTTDGSGYLMALSSVEQPIKSVNQDEDPVCVVYHHRSVSGSFLTENENFSVSCFLSLHLPSPRDGHSTAMFSPGHGTFLTFDGVLANVSDGTQGMHLQPSISYLHPWLDVPVCDSSL